MREAIPIVHLLVRRNLAGFATTFRQAGALAAHNRGELLAPHLGWLHATTEELARQGGYAVGARPVGSTPRRTTALPFTNTGRSVPLIAHGQGQARFAGAMVDALAVIEPHAQSLAGSVDDRLSLASRWIASAALTAHLDLAPNTPVPRSFAVLESPLGEDSAVTEAVYWRFMLDCPAALLLGLPQYKLCERVVSLEWRRLLTSSLELLTSNATPRQKYLAKGTVSNLLAYLTSNRPNDIADGGWPARRLDRAKLLLYRSGVCPSLNQAEDFLRSLDLADMFPSREQGGAALHEGKKAKRSARKRFETNGAEHAASHRGRLLYARLWARTFAEQHFLLPQLVDAQWRSEAARRTIHEEFGHLHLGAEAHRRAATDVERATLSIPSADEGKTQ